MNDFHLFIDFVVLFVRRKKKSSPKDCILYVTLKFTRLKTNIYERIWNNTFFSPRSSLNRAKCRTHVMSFPKSCKLNLQSKCRWCALSEIDTRLPFQPIYIKVILLNFGFFCEPPLWTRRVEKENLEMGSNKSNLMSAQWDEKHRIIFHKKCRRKNIRSPIRKRKSFQFIWQKKKKSLRVYKRKLLQLKIHILT